MSELNVDNFVKKIKDMSERDRKKVHQEDLINLIIQLPDNDVNYDSKILELTAAINGVRSQANSNAANILLLKSTNDDLHILNESAKVEMGLM